MKLLVGLGNPGAQYAGNRHNIGFMAADAIAAGHGFPQWRQKFQGSLAEGRIATVRTLLFKPETFMNLSGDAVQAAMRFFKLAPADVIVFHDELDLAPGKLRVKTGGGHAGHNGLRSIDAHIGPDFTRVRMGIGHPGDKRLVSNYVLSDFDRADAGWLEAVLAGLREGVPDLVAGDPARFLGTVAKRLAQVEEAAPASAPRRPEPRPTPPSEMPDTRSALQKLADRFR